MEPLIARWGLLAVFLGSGVESDTTMLLAGVASHLGLLSLTAAIGFGAAGGLLADLFLHAIGRSRADAIRSSRLYRRVGPHLERVTDRLGIWQIVFTRVVYGTRVATMLYWGTRRMPVWRFAAIDMLGCVLWAVVFASIGFVASGSATALLGEVRKVELRLLGALGAAAVLLLVLRFVSRRARKGSAGADGPESGLR